MTNIILCGGKGTRLWLISRILMLSQFNKLFFGKLNQSDKSLKKLTTVSRLHNLGSRYKVELKNGIKKIYEWYKNAKK